MFLTSTPRQSWYPVTHLSRIAFAALLALGWIAGAAGAQAVFPPPGRFGHTAVLDSVHDRIVVFGGADPASHNDVWVFPLAGTSGWSALAPTGTPPPARQDHTAVYDSARDRIVVFGGFAAGSGFRDDIWILSLSGTPEWSAIAPAGSHPSPRGAHAAVYDPVRDRLVVIGGQDAVSGSRNDVWELPLSGYPVWRAISPEGNPPSARYGHTAIYDPAGDRIVVFGGYDASTGSRNDTWALSLSGKTAWSALAPAGKRPHVRYGHTAIHDAARNRMVVFGGRDGYGPRNDVWTLSLAGSPAWSALARADSTPSARSAHASVYDPAHARMVTFGGTGDGPLGDVWALTLSGDPAWAAVAPAVHPSTKGQPWPFMVSLAGGFAMPSGAFSDAGTFNAKPGSHFAASIDHLFTDRIALGLDGSYNSNKRDTEGADATVASVEDEYTTIQFGVHAKYLLAPARDPWSLWVQLGVGGYSLTEDWTVTYNNGNPPTNDEGKDKTGMRPGARVGAGAGFRASKLVSLGVGADFNYVFLDKDKTDGQFYFEDAGGSVSSFQYVDLYAGITFHLGTK